MGHLKIIVNLCVVLGLVLVGGAAAEYAKTDIVAAAKSGDYHAVHKLLELDPEAAIAATDARGFTAFHWAGIRAHWRIFDELLAAGASPNAVGADGGTPLHWTCHHDNPVAVEMLIDAGAEIDVANQWGRTALHVAARRGCTAVAALLLEGGADVNATTREGWTPLHVASMAGHEDLVVLLTEAGADPGIKDAEGATPEELWRARPSPLALDNTRLDEYVGIYDLGGGFSFKIWPEEDGLAIREFAPDRLYPIGQDEFFCVQEPWRVRFERAADGKVNTIEVDFLRRTVRGERSLSPRYVGSATCIACHTGAEQGNTAVKWMRSRHGHAYWRLGSDWSLFLAQLRPQYHDLERPIEDGRCLLCHVTGAQDDDALFAAGFRPEEGVGCEACHGPGSEYIDPEVMADRGTFIQAGGFIPDQNTCRSCHRNDQNFDWAELWPKIAHPRPQESEGTS
jgi:hypothetical protein